MKNKKNILFISPYPQGIGPSQRFRFEQYLNFLSEKFDYTQKTFWDKKSWDVLFSKSNFLVKLKFLILAFLKRFILLFQMSEFNLVFIHREVAHIGPPLFEYIIKFILRKKIIYDL